MANISFFLDKIKGHVLRKHILYPNPEILHGIVILTEETTLLPGYLYVVHAPGHAMWLRKMTITRPVYLFLSDDTYLMDPLFKEKKLNIVSTDLDLLSLYNHLNSALMDYRSWTWRFMDAMSKGKSVHEIITLAGEMMSGPVFLLDLAYKIIAAGKETDFDDPYARELYDQGYISYRSVDRIKEAINKAPCKPKPMDIDLFQFHLPDTEHIYYLKYISANGRPVGMLIFITDAGMQKRVDIGDRICSLGNIISGYLSSKEENRLPQDDSFRLLLADFANRRYLSDAEIDNRFRLLPQPVEKYIYCIIIECSTPDPPYDYIMGQLQQLMPNINITLWKDQIVIMYSRARHDRELSDLVDLEQLNQLLEHYKGKAIFSAATHHYDKFGTIYLLSQRMLKILQKANMSSPYGHIWRFTDYTIYLNIDFATQFFQSFTGHSDIIYMTHPAIITLTRYDTKHKSDLRDTLFYYLQNGCNVGKTAQARFMHRNTVLNKLNKINQLVDLNLEDGRTQQQLMFSCQVVRYYEEVLDQDLVL